MVFSTPLFLYIFLPICLFLYYLTPVKYRNITLLSSSLLFYFWGEQSYALIMVASIFIDYYHGLLVAKHKEAGNNKKAKAAMIRSVIFNLTLLFFFKYANFLIETLHGFGFDQVQFLNVHLPIGISFFTFQTMSYTIDVYRGDAKAQKNIIHFGAFVTLFPQLIAGPILKYKDLGDQLDQRTHSVSKFASGIEIFVIGLCKKVLIANAVGQIWEMHRDAPVETMTVAGAWLGMIACGFQIYFDFSGYSDMAVGLGRMLGFEFLGNFNYPFISKSATEFWRRWHISLGSWFREYVYIPLGGNRVSKGRGIFNLLVIWMATGIWHGASWNYLMWGLYFFVILNIEKGPIGKKIEALPVLLRHFYFFCIIQMSWIIFGVEDLTQMGDYFRLLFGFTSAPFLNSEGAYYAMSYLPLLALATIASSPYPKMLFGKVEEKTRRVLSVVLLYMGIICSTAYIVDATYNPFLYFRF